MEWRRGERPVGRPAWRPAHQYAYPDSRVIAAV